MKKDILNLLKTTILFLLFFSFSTIIARILKININNSSTNQYCLFIALCDLGYLTLLIGLNFKKVKEDFIKFFKNFSSNFETSIKYWLIGFSIMIISNIIIIFVLKLDIANNEENVRTLIEKKPLFMIFSTLIYAPLSEEILFRKCFKDLFKEKYLYIIMSGMIFGTLHVASSLSSLYNLVHLIPYCVLGIVFASLYYKTDNIFSSISVHMLHNGLALGAYFIGFIL